MIISNSISVTLDMKSIHYVNFMQFPDNFSAKKENANHKQMRKQLGVFADLIYLQFASLKPWRHWYPGYWIFFAWIDNRKRFSGGAFWNLELQERLPSCCWVSYWEPLAGIRLRVLLRVVLLHFHLHHRMLIAAFPAWCHSESE